MSHVIGLGSSPRVKNSHSLDDSISGIMLQGVLDKIREISDYTTQTINLSGLTIHPCRGCFSDMETRCHYLCDCFDDDFKYLAQKIIEARAVVLATPTYMFGLSGRLKVFLERWISFKAPPIDQDRADKSLDECFDLLDDMARGRISVKNPLQGKIGGIVVAGSELGQDNIIKELMLIMNLYGFILPPQCFIYHTGHSMQSLFQVRETFFQNKWLLLATENMARGMVQMMRLTEGQTWPQMDKIIQPDKPGA